MSNSATTSNNDVDPGQFVAGQMLAQQREKMGLSIEECAETLKLSPAKVNALETGDKKPFASEVFIRGYLKSYAKLLRLSEDDLFERYYSQGTNTPPDDELVHKKKQSSKWWLPYVAGIIIIAAWFFVSDYLERQQLASSKQAESATNTVVPAIVVEEGQAELDLSSKLTAVTDNEVVESAEAQSESEEISQAAVQETLESSLAAQEGQVEQGDAAESSLEAEITEADLSGAAELVGQSEVEQPEQEVASVVDTAAQLALPSSEIESVAEDLTQVSGESGSDELLFSFSEQCWIQVVDANNATIVSSLREANTQLRLQGQAPFSIIVGNVDGASLQFNGEPVELEANNETGTLRLTLGG